MTTATQWVREKLHSSLACYRWTIRTNLCLVRWWRSDRHHHSWHWSQGRRTIFIWNINNCRQTSWHRVLTLSWAHRDLLHDAVIVIIPWRVETPAERPGETQAGRQDEVTAAHPALVGITYVQLFDTAWQVILHREVHLLVSAAVGAFEQMKCVVIRTLWEIIGKLDILSTTSNNHNYQTATKISTKCT